VGTLTPVWQMAGDLTISSSGCFPAAISINSVNGSTVEVYYTYTSSVLSSFFCQQETNITGNFKSIWQCSGNACHDINIPILFILVSETGGCTCTAFGCLCEDINIDEGNFFTAQWDNSEFYFVYASSSDDDWKSQDSYQTEICKTWDNTNITMSLSVNKTENISILNNGCCIPESTTISFLPNSSTVAIVFNLSESSNNWWCQVANVESGVVYYADVGWWGPDLACWWNENTNYSSQISKVIGLLYNITENNLTIEFGYANNTGYSFAACYYQILADKNQSNAGNHTLSGNLCENMTIIFIIMFLSFMILIVI
jgi:hypothetical protein